MSKIIRLAFGLSIVLSGASWADELVFNDQAVEQVKCTEQSCFFPDLKLCSEDIVVSGAIIWKGKQNLVLHTRGSIQFAKGAVLEILSEDASLRLCAGMEPGASKAGQGRVIFNGDGKQVILPKQGRGEVEVYYNPQPTGEYQHKYHRSENYSYSQHIQAGEAGRGMTAYMLVNSVEDLSDISAFLSGNYALSQDIDALISRRWNHQQGFVPIGHGVGNRTFSGNFDGNGYQISGLWINYRDLDWVGLFKTVMGREGHPIVIKNLTIREPKILGKRSVGSLAGAAIHCQVKNVRIIDSELEGENFLGGVIGMSNGVDIVKFSLGGKLKIKSAVSEENGVVGLFVGSANKTKVRLSNADDDLLVSLNENHKVFDVFGRANVSKVVLKFGETSLSGVSKGIGVESWSMPFISSFLKSPSGG